ncbi:MULTISPECIES: GAF domain-containing protein [unclassified Leptolyngbya]|uniref:GAF domain-containing protein n=1 Tax=unclassified Leptolyngbya TaxID=2650499 RepID=UPI0016824871|nr:MULTISPECIES: GAF domain-containing protein [unclassified Leptolyngbya]MBD1909425.1 GAF domain-containing protein [Leptolyngbya sp. FACHB-8]MBD2158589.1 GAF domain-containing protein [Leptolyngbya sp. FACHB-16]
MYTKNNSHSSTNTASENSYDALLGLPQRDLVSLIQGNNEPDEDMAWVQERRRLRAALNAVEMELQHDTEAATTALAQVKTELEKVGLLQRPDVKQEVDCLSNLMQGIHQGLGGYLSDSLQEHFEEIRQYVQRIADQIRQTDDMDTLMSIAVRAVRQFLDVERSLIYRFEGDQGVVAMESLEVGWTPMQSESLPVFYFGAKQARDYQRQQVVTLQGTHTDVSPYQKQLMERFQLQSSLAVPLFVKDKIWGLLVAQQCQQPRTWREATDINFMVQLGQLVSLALQQTLLQQMLTDQADKAIRYTQVIGQIGQRLVERLKRQDLDLNLLLASTTQDLRHALKADRVAVYQFSPDWSGEFIAEDRAPGWVKLVGTDLARVQDTFLQENQGGRYRQNQSLRVDNIYTVGHAPCHVELLSTWEAKAYMIAPIFNGDTLWGLLGAYQNSGFRHWEDADINLLSQVGVQLGNVLLQADVVKELQERNRQIAEATEQEREISRIIYKLRQSLDMQQSFQTTVTEVRRLLKVNRVLVYRFYPDWSGEVVAESVGSGWVALMQEQAVDPTLKTSLMSSERCIVKAYGSPARPDTDTYLKETQGGAYGRGELYRKVDDVYKAGFESCYLESLEKFQAKAYIGVPIFLRGELWGLLFVYQCDRPRTWTETEVNAMLKIAPQLGVALEQTEYIRQVEEQAKQLQEAAEREKADKTQLQLQIVQMLTAVRPALQGDLTVRAPVTEDAVGTVADAYNNTIQALRKLVTQVKGATDRVRETSELNGTAIAHLSQQTQQELSQVTRALQKLEEMAQATESVTQNAQRMEAAVQRANETVQTGDNAMNLTVGGILAIRETVSETTKKIKRLSESSQKISKVVNLISNFTTQTQLLALNAAIEATRAGEYGRGFAVVADEVRSLAQQSSEATGEIEALVQEIQAETNGVSAAMDLGIQQVVEGTNLVNQTRQSLNEIVTATAQIRDLIQGITASAQAQGQQSNAVTQTMEEVAAIARKTCTDSTEIATSFQNLVQTAELLQKSVDQFKVN